MESSFPNEAEVDIQSLVVCAMQILLEQLIII